MGQTETKGAVEILRQFLSWAQRVFDLESLLDGLTDRRQRPRIPTRRIAHSLLVMFCTRLGSLNALEQTQKNRSWNDLLGGPLPSADSLGRIAGLLEISQLRDLLHALYTKLKRNKALLPTSHGLTALVLDAHESHATYNRSCIGCLKRWIKRKTGGQNQYFHKHVTAMLLTRPFPLLLDAEPLSKDGEELDAALRLLERVLQRYPRAFDVVLGDALYSDQRFYRLARAHGKDVLTVLKRNLPNLLTDAEAVFELCEPERNKHKRGETAVWDESQFQAWPDFDPVRVVRTYETKHIKRQLDATEDTLLSRWYWVTTLSTSRACTDAVVALGHARWEIENQGFNETTNRWHADHVYRHEAQAIPIFWLLAMVAYNLFHAFYSRQLTETYRRRYSYLHLARCMAGTLYEPAASARPP